MKLSDAIRLGSMLSPQADGVFRDSRTGGTCALGAALEAEGCLVKDDRNVELNVVALRRLYPLEFKTMMTCPACGTRASVLTIVAHLNNSPHSWTREQVAAWVEEQEQAVVVPVAVPAVVGAV